MFLLKTDSNIIFLLTNYESKTNVTNKYKARQISNIRNRFVYW